MNERTPQRFTLPELAAEAARHLASADVDQSSGRVSDVPSSRTIRYYSTHGLLDAPVDWEGRTAIYGHRHLMQLVAIKRLQARGAKLSEIQERLHSLPDLELAKIARLEPKADEAAESESTRGRGAFWAERGTPAPKEEVRRRERSSEEIGAMRLDDDVLLVIEGLARQLEEDDEHALRVAAEPLLHMLKARRLLGTGTNNGG